MRRPPQGFELLVYNSLLLAGVAVQYFIVNGLLWWLFHLSYIFFGVMFPFVARSWKKKEKYVHLLLLVVGEQYFKLNCGKLWSWILLHVTGLLFPLPQVIATLTQDDHGYILTNFPPSFCSPRNSDLLFYSYILVSSLCIMVGIPLLIIVGWTLHKVWLQFISVLFLEKVVLKGYKKTKTSYKYAEIQCIFISTSLGCIIWQHYLYIPIHNAIIASEMKKIMWITFSAEDWWYTCRKWCDVM